MENWNALQVAPKVTFSFQIQIQVCLHRNISLNLQNLSLLSDEFDYYAFKSDALKFSNQIRRLQWREIRKDGLSTNAYSMKYPRLS